MNIYLITQTVNTGYDAFSGAVVVAGSPREAKTLHPLWFDCYPEEFGKPWRVGTLTWAVNPDQVDCKLLGQYTGRKTKAHIALVSYHAG